MSSSAELKGALEEGTCLADYTQALQDSFGSFRKQDVHTYTLYYNVVCESSIPLKAKKALISALVKLGIPVKRSHVKPISTALKTRDFPLLFFLVRKTPMILSGDYLARSACETLGISTGDNQFSINMLNKIKTSPTIQKSFLRGAIIGNNKVLIKYIIEVLKPDLFIPTSQTRSVNSLAQAFASTGDVELLKYFEEHGYNIHECQRELLNHCYSNKKLTAAMQDYILADQEKSSAPDAYTEELANKAFCYGDPDMLRMFTNIKMVVKWTQVVYILKSQKEFIYFKTALDRFVEREKEMNARYNRSWLKKENGNWDILTQYHVNAVWRIAKDRKEIWEYFKDVMQHSSGPLYITYANKKDGTAKNNTTVESSSSDELEESSL